MKKFFIFIFLLSFSSQSYAYDCSFDKIKPGVTSKSLEEINIFTYGANSSLEILDYNTTSERICRGDPKDVRGLIIVLTFAGDKLIKVNYINTIPNRPILFDIANNHYKTNFKRNNEQVKKKQTELYNTTVNNNSYFYVLLKNKDQQQEYLEISSDKDIEKLEKFLLKIEEAK